MITILMGIKGEDFKQLGRTLYLGSLLKSKRSESLMLDAWTRMHGAFVCSDLFRW